jgi:hypothetical protein
MKKRLLLTSAVAMSLTVAGLAFAQTPAAKETAKQRVAALKQETKLTKCEAVQSKVEKQIKTFEANKEKHVTSYNKIKDKLQKFINRLDDKGYDTSKLKEDLIAFDAKLKNFGSDYATYISLLRETEDYTCDRSAAEFKAKLQTARDQLKKVHDDAVDIRTFYAKTFRQDILALKEQKPKTENDEEESENDNETNTESGR